MAITSYAAPERWDFLELHAADKWPPYSFEVVDETDTAISLVGASVTMHIRKQPGSTPIVKELTQADGFDVSGNLVTFDTDVDIAPGEYYHDIKILLSGETLPHTQYKGMVTVYPNVSR